MPPAGERANAHMRWAVRYTNKAASHFRRAREYDAKASFGAAESVTVNLDSKEGDGLLDASGSVRVVFEGAVIPCTITPTASEIEIVVAGDPRECLNFSVYTGKSQANISILEVRSIVCPLPDTKFKGAFLLRFAEEICRQIGIRSVTLKDGSTIPCGAASVDLQFLSCITHGRSWYERQGFSYQNAPERHNISAVAGSSISEICKSLSALDAEKQGQLKPSWLAEDIADFKEFRPEFRNEEYAASVCKKAVGKRTLPERLFMRTLTEDYGFSELSSKVARMCVLADRYKRSGHVTQLTQLGLPAMKRSKGESNTDSLGGFLVSLWSSSMCTEYVDAISLLCPAIPKRAEAAARGYIDPSILPRYVRGDTSMIKHL